MDRLLRVIGIASVAVRVAGILSAQTPASPAFEAASVKLNKSGDVGIGGGGTRGTAYSVTNIPLRVLIGQAYGVRQSSELIGGPAWLDTDRYDIVATMERPGAAMPMVRTLLADRFKLVIHKESRELPIYALVVARNDGRLGPKLRSSTCVPGRRPDGNATRSLCGSMRPGPGVFVGSGVPLSILIDASLSSSVQRKVVDRTGLEGSFDIDLHWLPDDPQRGPETAPPPDSDAPSLFTALQEQLGLKLEPTKGPVDVLVIDRVERPTGD